MDQRRAKGEETKQKIIESAVQIVSIEGIKGLSAKKVADHAGVSKSNIFHHFGSVDDILLAIATGLCDTITESLANIKFNNLEDFFAAMGDSTFNLPKEDLAYYRVLFAFYNDAVFHDRYKDQLLDMKHAFGDYIAEMVFKIEGTKISEELAEIITIDIDGLGLHFLIDSDSERFRAMWLIKSKQYISYIRENK